MRSFLSTAAIAAALLASPLTAAFAASAHDHEPNSFGGRGAGFHERNANVHGGDADTGTITYAPNGQLDAILNDLNDANARISYDSAHGLITPRQAHRLHAEDAMIRSEAVRDNARHGGAIPMGQYEQLMRQVDNLRHQYS